MVKEKARDSMPLTNHLPSIDLHGEDRKSAEILVKQFIDDLWKLKCSKAMIVHGIGSGVLKKQVHEVLKKDKRVEKYYINFFNVGCTIIDLKKNI